MPFIEWNDRDLILDIERMDREHRELIEVMNRLYDTSFEPGVSKNRLHDIFEDLVGKVVIHFLHEEAFLHAVGYPQIDLHKAVHKRLLARLHQHMSEFERGNGGIAKQCFGFLSIWLTSHIMGNDRDYANYVLDWKRQMNSKI